MNKEKVWGIHALQSALQQKNVTVSKVYVLQGRQDKRLQPLLDELQSHNVPCETVSRRELDDMSQGQRHQGIIAEVSSQTRYKEADLDALIDAAEQPFVLILDGVTDPHNLGAILRTADAAGVTCVIAPKDNAASINSTVRKVACGAADTVPFVQVTNLVRSMKQLQDKGIWLYGTAGEAQESLYQTKLDGAIGIVMGAEGQGLRRLTRENCDFLINIPMAGSVSSLNVSVATGLCLFEVVRTRS